ncbi:helix-turn-helix domain-containing protein [Algiphilus aromaticivorans]|uniref:helix-turn-helix domain-containing protein n=1 Tax=Algiphilus aromaticivorans TaxID=382454 RepID=UPI0005C17DB9|nr:helix-turn-helix transcriptional regulator [Algiphilus aromaticivorans]
MKIKLKNRLSLLMEDSGIPSYEKLAEALTNQGFPITRSTLSRIARNPSANLNLQFVEALCNTLQCLPGDVYGVEITEAAQEEAEAIQSRLLPFRYGSISLGTAKGRAEQARPDQAPSSEEAKPADEDEALGPKVTHLSKDALKDRN